MENTLPINSLQDSKQEYEIVDTMIKFGNILTNFSNREIESTGSSLYSLDSNDRLHLDLIPGVLKLSSKRFKTTKTKGYIMKEFEPAFGYLPTFMVKTDKLKDYTDKYVIVRVSHVYNKVTGQRSITGVIDNGYIGNVGDEKTEKELCKIISTAHWCRSKIERARCFDKSNKYEESVKLAEFQKIGITFTDQTPDRYDMSLSKSTDMLTLSVDPIGSKDIDDAISIELIDDSNVRIGIHIADPSSWLIEDSILDQEVAKRAESVYLRDQTFHMFPEYLSTSVFSLVSDRTNRAFSVLLELSDDKKSGEWIITKKTITKTIIKIDRNMSYDEFQTEHKTNSKMSLMYYIGNFLYTKFLNSQKLVPYDSKKMIEIFMVLANSIVAEQMVQICSSNSCLSSYPILIRSQKTSGYMFDRTEHEFEEQTTESLSNLIDEHIKLHMSSAEIRFYSNNARNSKDITNSDHNRHHSLGLDLYTHFTSPIRRYSDILVHRIMWNLLTHNNEAHKFKLICLDRSDLHQIFVMNHYKQFYKRVYGLENDINITHHYINSVGKDPMNRVHQLQGIVMDIIYKNDNKGSDCVHKIKIKCTGMCEDNELNHDHILTKKFVESHNKLFQNTIHTVTVSVDQSIDNKFELFAPIKYQVCYLARDVRKIRLFL